MNFIQTIAAIFIGLVIVANLMYPGGWVLAGLIILAIIVLYALSEFLPEYILVTNQGKNARKDKQRKRRARGLNPFSRTSKRESRQPRQDSDGGRNE